MGFAGLLKSRVVMSHFQINTIIQRCFKSVRKVPLTPAAVDVI